MGIYIKGRAVDAIYVNGRSIKSVYIKDRLVWPEALDIILSCFYNGYWIDEYPWTDDTPWVDLN